MPNQLVHETSPYLLQHAHNPVDWCPWGPEALERARAENRPIFLSIGYSACHWCHVMEHESFEDPEIARLLNDNFVCIKVDREERPDLDQIYMQAVQAMTGRGGWPMSVFLTPELDPFYGGTYWPPRSRMGMPGFDQVVASVTQAWQQRRDEAAAQARQLREHIASISAARAPATELKEDLLSAAAAHLQQTFDPIHGGFGAAPKFPHAMDLQLLLRLEQRLRQSALGSVVRTTLDKMAAGGIYDHLGGGFARYSVDQRWLVPHFEKMLYDNALLAATYVDAFLATGNEQDAIVVREILDYILRDMTDPAGGFHSTEDADSQGEEGKFYVWTPAEIERVLGPDVAARFCYVYDVSEGGNFEGRNILHLSRTWEQSARQLQTDPKTLRRQMDEARLKLRAVRSERIRPAKDDKILVSWNGLMVDALARAARALNEPEYLKAAVNAARFLQNHLRKSDGRLLHCWRQGQAKLDAYLDDYAMLANALVSLYEASLDEIWLAWSCELLEFILQDFRDDDTGACFYTAEHHESLIVRVRDLHDNAVPSGNAMAAMALLRAGRLTCRTDFLEAAEAILMAASGLMQRVPAAMSQMLIALDLWLGPLHEIVIVGNVHDLHVTETLRDFNQRFLPRTVLAVRDEQQLAPHANLLAPLFSGKQALDETPTVYACEQGTCQRPVTGRQQAAAVWDKLAK